MFVRTRYKKTDDLSMYKLMTAVFWFGIILDRLLKNCTTFILILD